MTKVLVIGGMWLLAGMTGEDSPSGMSEAGAAPDARNLLPGQGSGEASSPQQAERAAPAQRIDEWGIIAVPGEGDEIVTLRLAGIELPRPGAPGHDRTMRALDAALAQADSITVRPAAADTDRFGHRIADLDLGTETLAARLVRDGHAIAYSWRDTAERAAEFLALEREARAQRRGLWGDGVFVVRAPEPNALALYLETVQIVEGRIVAVGETRDRTYLNFGFDYRTDFTVSIVRQHVDDFTAAGIDLSALEGHVVRVRGWLQPINGPSMALDHPERMELLTPVSPAY